MMPGGGDTITKYTEPSGDGVRVDSAGFYSGLKPSQSYDPLISKLICTGNTWESALSRSLNSLNDYTIQGLNSNISALQRILDHAEFKKNTIFTSFLADNPGLLNPEIGQVSASSNK